MLELRLKESQLLLVLALHEADKALNKSVEKKDKEFYSDFVLRLKLALADNNEALSYSDKLPVSINADFEYKETKNITFLTPISDAGLAWICEVFPQSTQPALNKAFSMDKYIAAQAVERLAHDGLRLKLA